MNEIEMGVYRIFYLYNGLSSQQLSDPRFMNRTFREMKLDQLDVFMSRKGIGKIFGVRVPAELHDRLWKDFGGTPALMAEMISDLKPTRSVTRDREQTLHGMGVFL